MHAGELPRQASPHRSDTDGCQSLSRYVRLNYAPADFARESLTNPPVGPTIPIATSHLISWNGWGIGTYIGDSTMSVITEEQTVVTLTDEAAMQVKTLIEKQGRTDLALRLFVTQGRCSGFSYGMALDPYTRADDECYEKD